MDKEDEASSNKKNLEEPKAKVMGAGHMGIGEIKKCGWCVQGCVYLNLIASKVSQILLK